jgi:hypothetical protein
VKPDSLGFTREQVSELLLAEFDEWMTGQTVAEGPDGTARYYQRDVESFVRQIRKHISGPQRGVTD